MIHTCLLLINSNVTLTELILANPNQYVFDLVIVLETFHCIIQCSNEKIVNEIMNIRCMNWIVCIQNQLRYFLGIPSLPPNFFTICLLKLVYSYRGNLHCNCALLYDILFWSNITQILCFVIYLHPSNVHNMWSGLERKMRK